MHIRSKDRVLEVDEPGVKIYDYNLNDKRLGISYQELNGRVPGEGVGINTECDEWYFVIEGKTEVNIDQKKYSAEEGDIIFIPKGSTSHLTANSLKLLTITRPDWFQQQHKVVNSNAS